MEPITLCGLVVVMFCLWVELEPAVRAVVNKACKSRWFTSQPTAQKPVYVRRMPICVAKGFHY
jgi:hypothetical protein